jgi:hypothetical protein
LGVKETLDTGFANLEDEVTSGLVVDPKKLRQQIKLSLSHANTRDEQGAILLRCYQTFVYNLLNLVLLGLGEVGQGMGGSLSIVVVPSKGDVAHSSHGLKVSGSLRVRLETIRKPE